MIKNSQKITDVWALLRQKEKEKGLTNLSLIERDVLINLAFTIGDDKQISLNNILNQFEYPRASFFRVLKKLREQKFIKIVKQTDDKRKSLVLLLRNINE